MHIAVVGTGNVGRSTAFHILTRGLADELSLVDIKPGLARAVAEELKHAATGLRIETEINWFDRDEDLGGADLIIISAGYPRLPGQRISRRELAGKNAEIIASLAEALPPRNPGARYVVVTNPVDAMATLFKRLSGAGFVISTGTHLETLRMRAKVAEVMGVRRADVRGFAAGEHGKAATILWSTVRAGGREVPESLRNEVEEYMKSVSEEIIDGAGATRFGPAVAFAEIVSSMVRNEGRLLSVAAPRRVADLPAEVCVSVPTVVNWDLGPDIMGELPKHEVGAIEEAAWAIYETYRRALQHLGME